MIVAVEVAVSVGVKVGVAVGLGVDVIVGVNVGGSEVGLRRVGIDVGKGAVGANTIFPIAINKRHSKIARTARILNCGQVKLRKVFLGLLGGLGIQEPFAGRILRNKMSRNCYLSYSGCKKYAKSLQDVAIIPIHYRCEKGQCWLSRLKKDGKDSQETLAAILENHGQNQRP